MKAFTHPVVHTYKKVAAFVPQISHFSPTRATAV
jgi:hypothetical protein